MAQLNIAPLNFVMWDALPKGKNLSWERQWFGDELDPSSHFNVRGLGIREPMFNANVHRPIGTGDWLIMFFHEPARLNRNDALPNVEANTLMLWAPGDEQFYSWGKTADIEPHSWMHVEGTWVSQLISEIHLPTSAPISVDDESLMTHSLKSMMREMSEQEHPDQIILQNLFQNWVREIARCHRPESSAPQIPETILNVRKHLDEHFTQIASLDELAQIACMSRSYLCHQFKECFGTTISRYVIRRRMSVAQRLLFDVSRPLGDIAIEVGYSDIFQFSKQFKKSFGVSPTQYRKQFRR